MKKYGVFVASLLVFALVLGGAGAVSAAEWPKEKPFTMLIPFAVGGGTDFNARLVAKIMEDVLGVRVNSINRTGGQGVVGHTAIAQGEPDGYTLGDIECELNMMHWAGLTDLTYRDLTPLALIVSVGGAVFVEQDSAKDIKDLLAAIKENPGKLKASGASTAESGTLRGRDAAGRGLKVSDVIMGPNEGQPLPAGHGRWRA